MISLADGPAESCDILPNGTTQGFDAPIGTLDARVRAGQGIDVVA
jgi:hypothetical protein